MLCYAWITIRREKISKPAKIDGNVWHGNCNYFSEKLFERSTID
jgi:hypothetical protein